MKTQGGEIDRTLFRVQTKFHLVSKVLVTCCVSFCYLPFSFIRFLFYEKFMKIGGGEAIPIPAGLEQTINKVAQRGRPKALLG